VAQNREFEEKDELWKKLSFEVQNSPLKDLWQILSLKDAKNAFHIISRPSFSYEEKTPYDILKNILLEKYLMPCLDDVAKSIFLDDDPDFPLLRDLLNALLYDGEEVIVSLEVGLSELPKKYKFEKRTVFDIRATLDTGDRVHIEFQVLVKKSLKQRVLFYWAKHFTQGVEEGDDYALLAPTISVWILEEFFSSHPTAFSQYSVFERSTLKEEFPHLKICLLEYLKPLGEGVNEKLKAWQKFFSIKTEEDIKEVKMMSPAVSKAADKLVVLSSKPEFRSTSYHDYYKNLDHYMDLTVAKHEAKEEGKEEGKEEERKNLMCRLFSNKLKTSYESILNILKDTSFSQLKILSDSLFSINSVDELVSKVNSKEIRSSK